MEEEGKQVAEPPVVPAAEQPAEDRPVGQRVEVAAAEGRLPGSGDGVGFRGEVEDEEE